VPAPVVATQVLADLKRMEPPNAAWRRVQQELSAVLEADIAKSEAGLDPVRSVDDPAIRSMQRAWLAARSTAEPQ
jgi:hypothetical protein